MGEHTPGEWLQSHRKGEDGQYRTQIYTADGEPICTLAWYPKRNADGSTSTYREANARLIAAAPDLLEALEQIANADSNQSPLNVTACYEAMKAIAHAALSAASGRAPTNKEE